MTNPVMKDKVYEIIVIKDEDGKDRVLKRTEPMSPVAIDDRVRDVVKKAMDEKKGK